MIHCQSLPSSARYVSSSMIITTLRFACKTSLTTTFSCCFWLPACVSAAVGLDFSFLSIPTQGAEGFRHLVSRLPFQRLLHLSVTESRRTAKNRFAFDALTFLQECQDLGAQLYPVDTKCGTTMNFFAPECSRL